MNSDPDLSLSSRPPLPDQGAVRRLGLRLFLLSLTVFFAASMVAFTAIRLTKPDKVDSIRVPPVMWLSTVILLLAGMAMEGSAQYARTARQPEVNRWLKIAMGFGVVFLAVQSLAMARLLELHTISLTQDAIVGLHGVTFVLILIHAIHVVGGIVPLGMLTARAHSDTLTLDCLPHVRSVATYWHFLEVVWVCMLVMFYVAF
ncbi:MAG: cytochrome c oxidase subunit 3 [Candidatus Latescibacterota bacterium]|nr:cytochrome c oxidase subunit 3 [Candidatus Latescibacterota bacterium]